MKRIFIVGCARSGTTLVQKLLAAHKEVYTCKETHYFHRIRRRGKKKVLDYLAVSQQSVLEAYNFISSNNELLNQYDPGSVRTLRSAVLFFDEIMTSEAQARAKSAWVEKTPAHLVSIPLIRRYIRSAQFVHVIRDGRDVVASLVDAATRFPKRWNKHRDLQTPIRLYNLRLEQSLQYLGGEGHVFVQYEHILDDAEGVSRKLCASLGLDPELSLDLTGIHELVVRRDEGWKNDAKDEIRDTRLVKFNKLFNEEQRRFINSRVQDWPPGLIEQMI